MRVVDRLDGKGPVGQRTNTLARGVLPLTNAATALLHGPARPVANAKGGPAAGGGPAGGGRSGGSGSMTEGSGAEFTVQLEYNGLPAGTLKGTMHIRVSASWRGGAAGAVPTTCLLRGLRASRPEG